MLQMFRLIPTIILKAFVFTCLICIVATMTTTAAAAAAAADSSLSDIKNEQRLQIGFDPAQQRERLKRDRAFFTVEPSDVSVNQGATISLPCALNETSLSDYVGFPIDVTKFESAWYKSGEPVLITGFNYTKSDSFDRYELVGNRSKGEFHIRIVNVDMKKDSGIWRCKFNSGLISSLPATLNVIDHAGPDLRIRSDSSPNTPKYVSPEARIQKKTVLTRQTPIKAAPKSVIGVRPRLVPISLPWAGRPLPIGIKPFHACLDDKFLVTIDFNLPPEERGTEGLPGTGTRSDDDQQNISLFVPKTSFNSPNYTADQLLGLSKSEFLKSLNQIFHISPPTAALVSKRRIKRVKRAGRGHHDFNDEKCRLEYTYNNRAGNNSVSFYIPYKGCGTILNDYFGDQKISNLTNSVSIVLMKNKDGSGEMGLKHHIIEKNNDSFSPLGNKWTRFSYFSYDPPQKILGTFIFSCFLPTPMKDMINMMTTLNHNPKGIVASKNVGFREIELSKEPVPQKRHLPPDCPVELKDMDFQMDFDCQIDEFDIQLKFPSPFLGEIKVMGDESNFHEKCNYRLKRQLTYRLKIPFNRCSTRSSTQYEPYNNGIAMGLSKAGPASSQYQAQRNRPLFTKFSEFNVTLYFEQHCSRTFVIRKVNCQRWDPLYYIPENF